MFRTLKFSRNFPSRPQFSGSLYTQGERNDYLIKAYRDSWDNYKVTGWLLIVNPDSDAQRTYIFDRQSQAREQANIIESQKGLWS